MEDEKTLTDFSFDDVVASLPSLDEEESFEKSSNESDKTELETEKTENPQTDVEKLKEIEKIEIEDGEDESEKDSAIESVESNEYEKAEKEVEDFDFAAFSDALSEDSLDSVEDFEDEDDEIEERENAIEVLSNDLFESQSTVTMAQIEQQKEKIISVMEKESELLDKILFVQKEIHDFVREKDWVDLNDTLEKLQNLSDEFSSLEEEREILCADIDIRREADFSKTIESVRGKLQKSKIENRVLNEYISTTRRFLQGIFDSVVPQRRNTLYSRTGRIIHSEPTAVAVDIEL